MTTGKTIALTRQTFVDKVMSLLFNMMLRFVIDFLPRNNCLSISWLQSPSAVILEPKKMSHMSHSGPMKDKGKFCHGDRKGDTQREVYSWPRLCCVCMFYLELLWPTHRVGQSKVELEIQNKVLEVCPDSTPCDRAHIFSHCLSQFETTFHYLQPHASFSQSVSQFSRSVMSDSLWPHESQHTRPPCPSQTPGVYSNSCPSSWWCHPAISSSVVPFSFHPQSLPASRSFPVSQLFTWGGQSIGVSASTSVLPMNTQDLSPLGWTGWIFLQSKGLSRVFSNTIVQKHQFFWHSAFFTVQLSHPYMTMVKTIALTRRIFVGKVMSLLFNMVSRLVINFPSKE